MECGERFACIYFVRPEILESFGCTFFSECPENYYFASVNFCRIACFYQQNYLPFKVYGNFESCQNCVANVSRKRMNLFQFLDLFCSIFNSHAFTMYCIENFDITNEILLFLLGSLIQRKSICLGYSKPRYLWLQGGVITTKIP